MKKRLLFTLMIILFIFIIGYILFSPLYKQKSVSINYGITPYDICQKQPDLWNFIKIYFIFSILTNSIIIANLLYTKLLHR